MADGTNKHANRSAATRHKFVRAAQKLYAEHSIDAVSLNQVTAAAGQKNRNALQYHFGNREGLIQAILDSHADRVDALRRTYVDAMETTEKTKRFIIQMLDIDEDTDQVATCLTPLCVKYHRKVLYTRQ